MSPQGTPLTQKVARRLSEQEHLVILCGHYEGMDERVIEDFIDEEEKKKRLAILNDKVKAAHLKSNEKYIGRTLEILIDGVKDNVYQGRTRNNKVVHIEDNKEYQIGEFVNVEIKRVTTWCMFGVSV